MRKFGVWTAAFVSVAGGGGILAGLISAPVQSGAAVPAVATSTVVAQATAVRPSSEQARSVDQAQSLAQAQSLGWDRATLAVVKQADALGASIAEARRQMATVVGQAYARLHESELSVASERSALAAEQTQLAQEARRLSVQGSSLVAESATLRQEAASLRTAQSRFAAEVAAARASASARASGTPVHDDGGSGSYGSSGHDD